MLLIHLSIPLEPCIFVSVVLKSGPRWSDPSIILIAQFYTSHGSSNDDVLAKIIQGLPICRSDWSSFNFEETAAKGVRKLTPDARTRRISKAKCRKPQKSTSTHSADSY